MSVLIFLIILSALIVVHELGHFLVARFFGIRVDEFGLGFPPRAARLFTWKGTPFTLNWLPFGGFVKIFGENPEQLELSAHGQEGNSRPIPIAPDSFQSKNRGIQGAVLVAGVVGNFVFAWLLFSIGFTIGLPAPENFSLPVENTHTVITEVLKNSPADIIGLKSGDTIVSLSRGKVQSGLKPEELSSFIAQLPEPVTFRIERGEEIREKTVLPRQGIVDGKLAIGISMDVVGIVKLPFYKALWHGLRTTWKLTLLTAEALGTFIFNALGGRADLSGVAGPVGIVGIVGDTLELGFIYLLTFTALISINLSIINLMPFPALDGGRLLFVIIEFITRRRIPSRIFNTLNTAGFALLILLMVLITIRDVRNIF